MTVIASGSGIPYNTSYSFEDPLLHPYQRRADKRLNFILDQLDLGSDANLGYTKVTWLPDSIVRVRYQAQEGITQPIIVVRVEFQEDFRNNFNQEKLAELLEELEDEDDDEPPPRKYIPFMWVGIAAIDHSLAGGFADNPNCGFWGYPIDPHLCGFDPRQAGAQQVAYDFEHSCESLPGLLYIGGDWGSRVGNNGSQQKFFTVNGGQTWTLNQFGIDQGTFQDSDWVLSTNGLVQATHSNMIALEHIDTQVTQPVAALGTGLSKLPDGYWKRSIIVAPGGIAFPNGSFGYLNKVGGGVEATMSATYSGGTIVSELISGKYEIQAFSQTFQCECTQARIHIRFVMGDGAGDVTVTDFFPVGIGTPPENNRMFYKRDLVLGGNPPCGFGTSEEAVFGPNDGGIGWWELSVMADVANGIVSDTGTAHRDAPFFSSGCDATPKKGPDFPGCKGCSGETTVAPANNLDYPGGVHWLTFNSPGGQSTLDLRGGVLWHMGRVAQIDADGHVCRIVLLGNDGAAGACGCTPFSYGTNMPALGVSADIPLGSNLTELCGPEQCQVPFGVGEQVVVVGWTNFFGVPCGVIGGGWRLIVTKPHGGHGEDFTSLFWSDLRCGDAKAVEEFFNKVENAFAQRAECSGPPSGVTCAAGRDCSGQLTCTGSS